MNKPKIINLMPHGPAYDFSPGEKPDVWWEKADGGFLGFWTREWPDLLGEAVLKQCDRYDWEVWQPDYRVDRIYSKTLKSGVTHRLFPAEERTYRLGLESRKGFFSETMISHLKKYQNNPMILKLYSTYGLQSPFYHEILRIFGPTRKFPVFFAGLGMFKTPISEMAGLHRPMTYLYLITEYSQLKTILRRVDVISELADSALKEVRRIYTGRIEKFTMWCDFDFWSPVPSIEMKKSIRREMNIPQGKTVFLATGNFIPRKQFDKLIEAFKSIGRRNDFFLIIVGHGDNAYTRKLLDLAEPLIGQGKLLLHPYAREERLRSLYWISDLCVSAATDEGCSVTVLEAMACGLPVISTPVGETTEMMKKHKVGRFIPVSKYDGWAPVIEDILNNGLPKPLDRQIARNAYHAEYVAKRFIRVYNDLIS